MGRGELHSRSPCICNGDPGGDASINRHHSASQLPPQLKTISHTIAAAAFSSANPAPSPAAALFLLQEQRPTGFHALGPERTLARKKRISLSSAHTPQETGPGRQSFFYINGFLVAISIRLPAGKRGMRTSYWEAP